MNYPSLLIGCYQPPLVPARFAIDAAEHPTNKGLTSTNRPLSETDTQTCPPN